METNPRDSRIGYVSTEIQMTNDDRIVIERMKKKQKKEVDMIIE